MRVLTILCAFFVVFSATVVAQSKRSDKWNEGSITLPNGKILKGLISYDRKGGYASFSNTDGEAIYKNADILMMTFFDKKFQRQRTFYSLAHEDNASLFEVMATFKKVVILSIMGSVFEREKRSRNIDSFSYRDYMPGKQKSLKQTTQIETVFLMNTEGEMKPYMEVLYEEDGEVSMFNWQDEKSKVLETYKDNLPLIIPQPICDELEKYADNNGLNFKKRNEFLEILEKNRLLLD